MVRLGLRGPYILALATIDRRITRTSPGVYVLGKTEGSRFKIKYVGRSDRDVRGRLKEWVGRKFPEFEYEYHSSSIAAFERECQLWHDFGGPEDLLDNERHPVTPVGTAWRCPYCQIN